MKRPVLAILALLLLGILIPTSTSAADTNKIIKVGFPEVSGLSEVHEDGSYSGLVYDYLKEISRYTGWKYEFVTGDINTLMSMLASHEIDLLGGMFYRESAADFFDYASYNNGYVYSTLLVKDDNQTVNASDYKTIGVYAPAVAKINNLKNYLDASGITYTLKEYDDTDAFFSSLEKGEVDMLLSNDREQVEKSRIFVRFMSEAHYFVTYKGNTEVLQQLNAALARIKEVEPQFDRELYLKHFSESSDYQITFSDEEYAYMQAAKPLKVAVVSNWAPYQYVDDKDNVKGISADVLQLVSDATGLTFDYIQASSYMDAVELVQSGQADLAAGLPDQDQLGMNLDLTLTTPYLSFNKVIIKNKSAANDQDSILAIYPNSEYLMESEDMKQNHYDSFEQAVKAVNSGQADYTYGDWYTVESFLTNNIYRNITITTLMNPIEKMSFGINDQHDIQLLMIMNKVIGGISEDRLGTIILNNNMVLSQNVTLASWINSNPMTALLLVGIVIVSIILVMILFLKMNVAHNEQVYNLANTDKLTGGRTFSKFKEDAAKLLTSDARYVIAYSDVQMFKYINDRYGYAEGDAVLRKMAQLFEKRLGPAELFCRLTGDTFIVLLKYETREKLLQRYREYCDMLSQIKVGDASNYTVKLWTGFYCIEDSQTSSVLEMLDRAILAQKRIKNQGGESYAFYEDAIRYQMIREQDIESKMSAALINGEFVVYLQPKYDLKRQQPFGAEALVRWISPDGVIPPNEFIPLFERNGFIVQLDQYIFEQCCKLIRYWLDNGMTAVPIAVNVSRVQLSCDSFVSIYTELKEKYQIPDRYLELEFTESIVFNDTKRLISIVNELKEHGFTCAIDDFGVGYSSLTVLKNIPADCLKMDAQFFAEGHDKHKDTIMIESTMSMGKALNMQVVAEGIEEWDQLEYLKRIGCDIVQGYVFAKPMPVEQYELFMAEQSRDSYPQ